MATTEEVFNLIYDVQGKDNVAWLESNLDRLEKQHESLARVSDSASGRTANLGRTMLETGRIAQDFAQGGIGGILNNIEGFVSALGLGAGAAGALTALGVGAVFVLPKIIDFGRSLVESKNAVPPLSDEVARLTEVQKDNAKAIDALRAKGSLYAEDMAKLAKLTEDQIATEARLVAAREHQANLKQFGPGTDTTTTGRAAAFQKAVKETGGLEMNIEGFTRYFAKGFESPETIASIKKTVSNIFDEALKGDRDAIDQLIHAAQRDMTSDTGLLGTFYDINDPMKVAAKEKAEKEAKETADRDVRDRATNKRLAEQRFQSFQEAERLMNRQEQEDLENQIRDAEKEFRTAEKFSGLVPGSKEELAAKKVERSNELLEEIKQAIIDTAKKENPGLILRGPSFR